MRLECIQRFQASLPLIREKWIKLLSDEPLLSALGRPETVGCLMDVTFIQLLIGLQAVETGNPWRNRLVPAVSPVHLYLACGMTPVKKYFSTGEQAIRASIPDSLGQKTEDIIAVFKDIAAHEIESLCAACCHETSSCCEKVGADSKGISLT